MRRALPILLLSLAGCVRTAVPPAPPPSPPPVQYDDVTVRAGLSFTQTNGAAGRKLLPETMGSGCAFLDYDNDGWQDFVIVDGKAWNGPAKKSTLRLFHNDGQGQFHDATAEAGIHTGVYGMGVCVGDFDNDSWDDILVTGVGRCVLLRNEAGPGGRRRFRDVTASAGVASPGWSTSATWIDYDRDGRLDLFVCHYVKWSPTSNLPASVDGMRPTYSTPEQYPGESCRLYHNEGGGRFRDVTRAAGIYTDRSKALGVVSFDFDQDGWPDLMVANDTEPNLLFHNQGDGTFKEVALEMGVALNEQGKAKAGMGIDAGDDMNSGDDSVLVTNFSGEQFTLYRRESTGHYVDQAARSGIGNASQLYLGFGAMFLDYDGDGRLDIFVANGHIQGDVDVRRTGVVYREPALLFWNAGGGQYREATASSGQALQVAQIGRGAAWADVDNDGSPDILVTSNAGDPTTGRLPMDGRARLLRCSNRTGNSWIRIRLQGVQSSRNAYGARVRVRAGGRSLTQTVKCASSYLSQSDRRLLFGLGRAGKADSIEVQWPSGTVQAFGQTPGNRGYFLKEGGSLEQESAGRRVK